MRLAPALGVVSFVLFADYLKAVRSVMEKSLGRKRPVQIHDQRHVEANYSRSR
jgi:hypothetical protein